MKPAFSTLIHRIRLNSREDLHFELHQDGFRIRLELRIWKLDPRTARFRPSPRGFSLSRDHFEDFVAGLRLWGLRAEAWSRGIESGAAGRSVMVPDSPPGAFPGRD